VVVLPHGKFAARQEARPPSKSFCSSRVRVDLAASTAASRSSTAAFKAAAKSCSVSFCRNVLIVPRAGVGSSIQLGSAISQEPSVRQP
jgi:hypothetical protein